MMRVTILLTLMSLAHSFTPPKIIYGGWTPILPGHPFFFGTARKKQYESSYDSSYHQSAPHYNNHIHPQSHGGLGDHSQGYHGSHGDHPQGYHGSHGGHPQGYHGGYPSGDVYQQHPMSQYRDPHQDSHVDNKPMKDIFSYYPPQSSYESPKKNHKLNYKPVYMEVPRKPMDVLENPHKFVPYVLPSIKDLLPKDFNPGHQQAYLQVTPLGKVDPKSIRQVGHVNIDKIRYLHGGTVHDGHLTNHLQSHDAPRYPPIPQVESDLFVNNKQLYNIDDTRQSRSAAHILKGTPYQNHQSSAPLPLLNGKPYPGVNQQYVLYQQSKSTNAAPYYTKAGGEYQQQSYASAHSIAPHANSYPTTIEVYPEDKYTTLHADPTAHSDAPKDLISTQEITKGLTGPVKIVRSKKHPQTIYAIGSPKIYLAPGRYQYSPYEALTNSYIPKVLDHFAYKRRKSGKRYLKPSIIHDSPTVTDREVSIVHVPVGETYASHGSVYPDQIEAHSTPKSTQVQNNKGKYQDTDHHTNSHFIIDESYRQHGGHSDEDIGGDGLNVKETDAIYVGTKGLNPNEVQKVTVGPEEDGESQSKDGRQFFHAYYAPSDHVPPKGYTKMSVDEFKSLFQNAEIQYLPRKQAGELRLRRGSEKRND